MDRVYINEQGRNSDEHLDTVYKEVFDRWPNIEIDDRIAFGTLIDPYIQRLTGAIDIPFLSALHDLDTAIRWAGKFGAVLVQLDQDGELAKNVPVVDFPRAKVFVNIEGTGQWSYGVCVHHAVLLAGLFVLRHHAELVLNSADATAH